MLTLLTSVHVLIMHTMNMIFVASDLIIVQRATFDDFLTPCPNMNGIKVGQKIRPHLPAKKK